MTQPYATLTHEPENGGNGLRAGEGKTVAEPYRVTAFTIASATSSDMQARPSAGERAEDWR